MELGINLRWLKDWIDFKGFFPLFQNLFRAQVSGGDSVADKSNEISEPLGGGNADSPRQYKLTNFHIHKVLGKGSFGKVGGKGF